MEPFGKTIFDFLEYRDFLREHFDFCKERHHYFSFRHISSKLSIDPSSYVKILQKQLHLSDTSLSAVITYFKFAKKEERYFRALVAFNKAKKSDIATFYFDQLLNLRNPIGRKLDPERYEYFSHWYYIAMRELLNVYRFDGKDYHGLGARLIPSITDSQAKKAVASLERLGLIDRDAQGYFQLTEKFVSTGDAWESIAIRVVQKQMIRLGEESIDTIDKDQRDISSVTLSLSKAGFETMREQLKQMRKELMELAATEDAPEAVYQVNMQVFPLSTPQTRAARV